MQHRARSSAIKTRRLERGQGYGDTCGLHRKTTKDQYDAQRKEVDWETNWAPGALIHVASFDDSGGIHVADVWESPEKLNAFVEQRLMPAFQKLNLTPPNVEVYPAHNINTHSSISKYQVA